jgi:hypothetical protein
VAHRVGRRLVDGEHDAVDLLARQRQGLEPARELTPDEDELARVRRPAAVDELDPLTLGHDPGFHHGRDPETPPVAPSRPLG